MTTVSVQTITQIHCHVLAELGKDKNNTLLLNSNHQVGRECTHVHVSVWLSTLAVKAQRDGDNLRLMDLS